MKNRGGDTQANEDVKDILDRLEQSLERNELPSDVYGNETLFREEMRQIFARNWVFVGHESEIPNANDWVLRRIGMDEVIVTRQASGKINILSNYCAHRGAKLCAADSGNSSRFRCPYHGWTYKNNGEWAGAPHMGEAYGGRLDAKRWGLLTTTRVETTHGFIFATLSEETQPFEDFLAGAGWIMDIIAGLTPGGIRVAAPPERYRVNADWKNGADNFAGDVYHIDVAHFSTELAGVATDMASGMGHTWRVDMGAGHSFICQALGTWWGPGADYWGYSEEDRAKFDLTRLDKGQQDLLLRSPPTVGNIFPNLRYVRFPLALTPGGYDFRVFTSFAQWQPIAPGVMEIVNWMFVYDFEDEQAARESHELGQRNFGSAGFFEQDDVVVWEGVAEGAKSPWRRDRGVAYRYFSGAADRFVDQAPDFEWTGPGKLEKNSYNEAFMLAFWYQYLKLMRGNQPALPAVAEPELQGA